MVQFPASREPRITPRVDHACKRILIGVIVGVEIGSELHSVVPVVFVVLVVGHFCGYSFFLVAAGYLCGVCE